MERSTRWKSLGDAVWVQVSIHFEAPLSTVPAASLLPEVLAMMVNEYGAQVVSSLGSYGQNLGYKLVEGMA